MLYCGKALVVQSGRDTETGSPNKHFVVEGKKLPYKYRKNMKKQHKSAKQILYTI